MKNDTNEENEKFFCELKGKKKTDQVLEVGVDTGAYAGLGGSPLASGHINVVAKQSNTGLDSPKAVQGPHGDVLEHRVAC